MCNLQSSAGLDDDRLIVELCMTLDVQVGVDTHAHPEGKSSACYAILVSSEPQQRGNAGCHRS
jgi:hypothetical protein